MKYETVRRIEIRLYAAGLVAAVLGAGACLPAVAGDPEPPVAEQGEKQDKVTVVPYQSRSAPSHRVSLHDGRVFFLSQLEETDTGFVLHTLEKEVVEVERDEVAEIVEFKAE